jgi:hypothetical protein
MILDSFVLTIVAPYVLLTVGLAVGLYLFFTLKNEIARLDAEGNNITSRLEEVLRTSESERADARRDLARSVSRIEAAESGRLAAGSLPRERILQLHKQGETPAAIARTLGLPDGQVKLLLKVRCLVAETP